MKAPNTELFALMLWKHEEDFGWDIIDTNNFVNQLKSKFYEYNCNDEIKILVYKKVTNLN